ncbi:lipoprotein-releasing ABC transporter permease subunit [Arenicella xantha]|uniref:Lipoprotein-releasing system permease protein n=1 Tax=Arenicella xantha TaxID=644221 RepID=A0A395JMF7_9GAMM|nr:lipoprotein-releasing ABC transporter permease subunit [Arenicella xantha]RBP50838.1 lipoprotein-releasing system permease protein [Arenicella xantha]
MAKTNIPLMIGARYSRAKRRNGFISFISVISILGVALGVWVLISVMSIMNGFGKELRGRVLDVAPHVTVTGQGGWLSDWQGLTPALDKVQGVKGYAPYIYAQGLVTLNGSVTGALVKGVVPEEESKVSAIAEHMQEGSFAALKSGKYGVVLGEGLAYKIGASVGDKVTFISPQGQSTPAGLMPRQRRFDVVGVFGDFGPDEFDSALAYIHMNDAARLYKANKQVSGIRLTLDDPYLAREASVLLATELNYKYHVDNWTTQHESFFRALNVERRMVFITLFMIIIIAAFNIVSTLIMVVTEKRADIAILRTLGLSPSRVMGIFFVQGVTTGVVGTLIGAAAGIATSLNLAEIIVFIESLIGYELLPSSVYMVTDFPAELRFADVSLTVIGSIIISMVATLPPAWKASRTQPAEALRYE